MASPAEQTWDAAREILTIPYTPVVIGFFLGGIFLWSGIAKLRSQHETAVALTRFRITRVASKRAARFLIAIELVIGGGLIVSTSIASWWLLLSAFIGALALSSGIVAVLSVALRRPARFPCSCFGVSDDTISWRTLARAVLIALIAGIGVTIVALDGRPEAGVDQTVQLLIIATGVLALCAIVPAARNLLPYQDPFRLELGSRLEPQGLTWMPITDGEDHT